MPLTIGTRGSALALAQARLVQEGLRRSALAAELRVIKTTGDVLTEHALAAGAPAPAGADKGAFTKELEEALGDGRIDLAVHSLKDVPTTLPAGLALGAVLEREDPRDCLVSRFGEQLRELPRGAVVGTSSPRRRAQIRAATRGVRVEDLRGNLDTRLRRVADGELSAIVVAHAGLKRLGRADEVSEVLDLSLMLPAPGQGVIAVEIRAGDERVAAALRPLHHAASARAAQAERAFLAALGGGCRVPIAAHARDEAGALVLDGLVISIDGKTPVRGRRAGPDPEALGRALAEDLLARGAAGVLKAAPR